MSFEYVLYERKGPIAYITLNRPEKLNALNAGLMTEFQEAVGAVDADTEIRALIITGADRAFSNGFDIEKTTIPSTLCPAHQTPGAPGCKDWWKPS